MEGMHEDLGTRDLDARHYLRVLRHRKWVVIAFVVGTTAAAFGLSVIQTRMYQADALLLIRDRAANTGSVFSQSNAVENPTVVVQTQMQIITSRPVRDAVVAQLGPAGTSPAVNVSEVGQTDVVKVQASSPSPQTAAQVANAYANVLHRLYSDTGYQ